MSAEADAFALRSFALANGARIDARVSGEGAPLFLLHGVGGCSDAWVSLRKALQANRRLIAWNAPGYGESTLLPGDEPTVDDYAHAALRLLDAMRIARTDIVGHSMGGLIAARLASIAPDRVGRLVLADCSSGHKSYDEAKRKEILATRLSQDTSDPWAYARARAPKLLSASADSAVIEQACTILARLRQPGFGRAARMVATSDLFSFASGIRASTRVICGTEDQVTAEALNRRIAEAISGADYHSIEGAGHWSFLERPARFAALVTSHLDRHAVH